MRKILAAGNWKMNNTPSQAEAMINELKGIEKSVFKRVFAGKFSKKLYRLYEFAGGSAYGR